MPAPPPPPTQDPQNHFGVAPQDRTEEADDFDLYVTYDSAFGYCVPQHTNRGPEMTQQPNKSVKFYAPYLWDGVLCMCDLFMEISKEKQRFSVFKMVVVETILGSI